MNTTPIKKGRSGKIRHLLRMTAASLPPLPFAGLSPAQAAAKNVYAGSIGTVTRKKGFRFGALVLLFTCGVLFAMGGPGLAWVDPCDPGLSGNSDVDGDTVSNFCDLDDDNDGITDCVEKGLDTAKVPDVFVLSGSAVPVGNNEVSLTPESPGQAGQAGAAMFTDKVDFREPFTIAFEVYLGTRDWNGADGMAMVFHNDPDGSGALGRPGSALGAGGIKNGIALEFDTYHGSSENLGRYTSWWMDHTSIWDTDQMGGHLGRDPQSYLTRAIGHGNLEDGKWHEAEISWDPGTRTLSYTLNGADAGSVSPFHYRAYFGGAHRVHFGITAATGGYTNIQRIRFDDFCRLPLRLDTDGDGVPNHHDLDSDADGISDLAESGADAAVLDRDNDGEIDVSYLPVGGNGLADAIKGSNGENTGITPRDTDSDGTPDYHDLDSDADGCPDAIEGDRIPSLDCGDIGSDGSLDQGIYPADDRGRHLGAKLIQGVGSAADSSGNPCSDSDHCGTQGDTDGDTVADINDLDDDNDGVTDCVENGLDTAKVPDVFALSGSAVPVAYNEVSLTRNSPDQAGAAMSKDKIDFREPFTIAFQAYLGTRDWNGADGMAAVFHNDSRGSDALGRPGSALGAGGIRNGIALEFDTYPGSSENWPGYAAGKKRRYAKMTWWWMDHTSIWDTDQMGGHLGREPQSYLTRAIGHGNLEDGKWHEAEISWDPGTRTLSYTLDGAEAGSVSPFHYLAYFGGAHRVHFGITAATGGYTNPQSIRLGDFCSLPLQIDTDGDGIPNHHDLDSDADGISDLAENIADLETRIFWDWWNDGEIDPAYPVGDNGLADVIEGRNGQNTGITPRDTDNDGTPDYHDRDSDADGCPDAIEGIRRYSTGTWANVPSFYFGDTASDGSLDQNIYPADDRGRHDGAATQGVGFADNSSNNACTACDPDASGNSDFDGDTVSDICDLDDDNDGITDCIDNGLDNPEVTDVFALSGSAVPVGGDEVSLTQNSPHRAGAAMFTGKVDFRESFTLSFQAYLGDQDLAGGNGIAMVFHNDPVGSLALGRTGSDLGAAGIQNGIALAVGTRVNEDYTSIWDTDTFRGERPSNEYLSEPVGHPNLEDGRWHDVSVTWNLFLKTLSYRIDKPKGANAGSYRHDGTTDFVTEYFGGANRVHFGLTAGTGVAANVQKIRFTGFDFCSQPFWMDTDGDGRENRADLDSDGDGTWDLEESGADHATLDVDNDGEIDAAFPDTDGDGLSQEIEAAGGENTGTTPRDSNGDGLPDFLDPDS